MNNAQKRIYGLIGYPVKHSFSKVMQEAAFKACGINAEYRLFEIKPEELKDFLLTNIQVPDTEGNYYYSQDIVGFNITIPHKVKALEIATFVKNITIQSNRPVILAGAINTVKRESEKWYYYNTDIDGFIKALRDDLKFNSDGKKVFIFGCGGAGRAVVAGLIPQDGSKANKIYIYELNESVRDSAKEHFKRLDLADKVDFITTENIPEVIKKCDLLVNASPVGMKDGDPSAIDKQLLESNKNLFIYDVVYNRETQLIKDAHQLGIPAVGGLGMLLYQGMLSFQIWTGKPAPEKEMREALNKALAKL